MPERKTVRPPVAWERWCRVVAAAAAAQRPATEYFVDVIEAGLLAMEAGDAGKS